MRFVLRRDLNCFITIIVDALFRLENTLARKFAQAGFYSILYVITIMLFDKTTRKVLNWTIMAIGIFVIISMIMLYFPALWQS
jgi:hypothetical protein